MSDRSVTVISRGKGWFKDNRTRCEDTVDSDVTKYRVWKKRKCPFTEAWTIQCAIEEFNSLEHAEPWYVGEVEREVCVEVESEEKKESSSDGMTDEDYEYGGFPLRKRAE